MVIPVCDCGVLLITTVVMVVVAIGVCGYCSANKTTIRTIKNNHDQMVLSILLCCPTPVGNNNCKMTVIPNWFMTSSCHVVGTTAAATATGYSQLLHQ